MNLGMYLNMNVRQDFLAPLQPCSHFPLGLSLVNINVAVRKNHKISSSWDTWSISTPVNSPRPSSAATGLTELVDVLSSQMQ